MIDSIKSNEAWANRASLLLLMVLSLLILQTVWDYGLSWDEVFRYQSGETKIAYYKALVGGDFERAKFLRQHTDSYPGLYDLSVAGLRAISPFDDVVSGHFLIAAFGLLGIGGAMMLAREIGGPWLGLLAGILLAACSRYWGHMFINPKDIPFAATFVWGVWAIIRSVYSERELDLRWAWFFGVIAGVCMSVRVGGLLLFCYLGFFFLLRFLVCIFGSKSSISDLLGKLKGMILWFLCASLPALVLLLIFLPSMHANPFSTAVGALESVTSFGWEGVVLFEGIEYRADELPWNYLLTWLLIGLPDLWLVGGVSGLGVFVLRNIKRLSVFTSSECIKVSMLIFMAFFPPAFIILKSSTVYDGFRHILFVVPMIAVLSAFFMYKLLSELRSHKVRGILLFLLGSLFFGGLFDQIKIHPYQYTYFNRLSGGYVRGADRFDAEYWGTSYKEAVAGLVRYIREGNPKPVVDSVRVSMHPPYDRVLDRFGKIVVPPPALGAIYLPEGFIVVEPNEHPDFFISISRNGFADLLPGESIYEVRRMGVVLARVTAAPPDWN
ncbi:MAG: hypothetical protein ACPGN3_04955 [Opitutales bacterium]